MKFALNVQQKVGNFSHFAHLICDFVLPLYSLLLRNSQYNCLNGYEELALELPNRGKTRLGPMEQIAKQIFPTLKIEYVQRFSVPPVSFEDFPQWHNSAEAVDSFINYISRKLSIKSSGYDVVIVQRGLDREKYNGRKFYSASGADRRTIASGLEKLVIAVEKLHEHAVRVELEHLSFRDQVSLFLSAKILIAQHGAAFVHAHWMPKNGHLIELQCRRFRLCKSFVPSIAAIREHSVSTLFLPCERNASRLLMHIEDTDAIIKLIAK